MRINTNHCPECIRDFPECICGTCVKDTYDEENETADTCCCMIHRQNNTSCNKWTSCPDYIAQL